VTHRRIGPNCRDRDCEHLLDPPTLRPVHQTVLLLSPNNHYPIERGIAWIPGSVPNAA
jgi:hypothetical protein